MSRKKKRRTKKEALEKEVINVEEIMQMDDFRLFIAAVLKATRQRLGLSQRAFAELSGISERTISSIECCKTDFRISTINDIAKSLGVHFQELISGATLIDKDVEEIGAIKKKNHKICDGDCIEVREDL